MIGDTGSQSELERAYVCFQEQQFAEAENLCRGILEREPDNAQALQLLGVIARYMGFAREGVPILARASELEPSNTGMLKDLAQGQRQAGDHAGAIETTRRWLELDPVNAQAWADLATLQTEAGELDDARTSLREAIRLVPGFGDAWHSLARLKRFEPGDPDIAAMAQELQRPGVATNEIVSFNYALGKAFEDLDDLAKAMEYYAAGAEARHASVSYDADAFRAFTQATIDAFSELPADSGDEARPQPVFLVGMPRSGSTLVAQILDRHPDVASAGELTTFPALVGQLGQVLADRGGYPAGVDRLSAAELDQMAGAYRGQLPPEVQDKTLVVDKMLLNYLYCGLLAMVFPAARIVHCRRDPLDTCFSCFTTMFGVGQEYSYDLTQLGCHYGYYQRLMNHWEELLGDRMVAVDYESLVQEPEPVIRRLLESLGLDWDPACLDFAASGGAVRTASMAQVREPLYSRSVGRGRRFAAYLGPLIDALEEGGR